MDENKVYKVTLVRHQEQTYYTIAKNDEEALRAQWALIPDGWGNGEDYQSVKEITIDENFGKDDMYDDGCWLIAKRGKYNEIYHNYYEFIEQLKTQ
jgi:hypothetical protein